MYHNICESCAITHQSNIARASQAAIKRYKLLKCVFINLQDKFGTCTCTNTEHIPAPPRCYLQYIIEYFLSTRGYYGTVYPSPQK